MPVTQITLLPGYPEEARERLVKNVSLAVASVIDASPAGITTYVSEAATYQRDGAVRRQGGSSLPNASDLALAYLQAMEAGRLHELIKRGHGPLARKLHDESGSQMSIGFVQSAGFHGFQISQGQL